MDWLNAITGAVVALVTLVLREVIPWAAKSARSEARARKAEHEYLFDAYRHRIAEMEAESRHRVDEIEAEHRRRVADMTDMANSNLQRIRALEKAHDECQRDSAVMKAQIGNLEERLRTFEKGHG